MGSWPLALALATVREKGPFANAALGSPAYDHGLGGRPSRAARQREPTVLREPRQAQLDPRRDGVGFQRCARVVESRGIGDGDGGVGGEPDQAVA